MAPDFKPITLRPLTGILDVRSSIDDVPAGSYRFKQNFAISPDGKLGRALGFARFYDSVCPKNHDLHDQGVALADREPPTKLFMSVSNEGVRRLFSFTKSRMRVLDEAAGTWTVLRSGMGADGNDSLTQLRFGVAELQNHVVATNNFDLPQIHRLGTSTFGDITDLAGVTNEADADDGSGLTKAKVVVSWDSFVFLMNTEEGGQRFASRIRWCDQNKPLAWVPGTPSFADYQDLAYGERILAAIPFQGALFVLTDSAIWRCTPSLNTDPANPTFGLICTRIYSEPKDKARCLAFPNSVVEDGEAMWYIGEDAIYRFVPGQDIRPERVDWLHRATGLMFTDAVRRLDKRACESPVMEFRPATNPDGSAGLDELHVSWPTYDPPAIAVGDDEPPDCETYTVPPPIPGSGINRHTLVVNVKYQTADYREYGMTAYVNFRSDAAAVGDCNQQGILIGSLGQDYCLKEMDVGSARAIYNPATELFSTVGYFSVLRAIFPFDHFDAEKHIKSFMAAIVATNPDDPAVARLRLGMSDRVVEPNATNGQCQVLWRQLSNKPIKCAYTRTAAKYVTDNIKPADAGPLWNFHLRGKFLYYEVTIASADGTAPTTGLCHISRIEIEAKML